MPVDKQIWRLEKRREAIKLLGGVCMKCGTTDNLLFHHKDRDTKLMSISLLLRTRGWSAVLKELEKCELQCEDCHSKEHEARHGTVYKYSVHSCRCEECRYAYHHQHDLPGGKVNAVV